jgi:hypothetical protein
MRLLWSVHSLTAAAPEAIGAFAEVGADNYAAAPVRPRSRHLWTTFT